MLQKSQLSSVVVMLCGPHKFNDRVSPQFGRIDSAIRIATSLELPLRLCGAHRIHDLALFEARARGYGVTDVEALYDPHASTLNDVRSFLRHLQKNTRNNAHVLVRLVTDPEHMPRAHGMMIGEAETFLTEQRLIDIILCHATGSIPFTPVQMQNEIAGLDRYLRGLYQSRPDLSWGKPGLQLTSAA